MKGHFLKKQRYLEKRKVLFFQFLFKTARILIRYFWTILAPLIFFSKWQEFFFTFLLGQQDVPYKPRTRNTTILRHPVYICIMYTCDSFFDITWSLSMFLKTADIIYVKFLSITALYNIPENHTANLICSNHKH
jgi:hypothetical protein